MSSIIIGRSFSPDAALPVETKVRVPKSRTDFLFLETALTPLGRCFPHFREEIQGRGVVSYESDLALSLAASGAAYALECDISNEKLSAARALAETHSLAKRVRFRKYLLKSDQASYDLVISQDGMNRFSDPQSALMEMNSLLKPGGEIWISFQVLNESSLQRGKLETLTVRKFQELVERSGLAVARLERRASGKWAFMSKFPLIGSSFVDEVVCVLRRPAH